MPAAFADVVTSAAWRDEAEAWIGAAVATRGQRVTGPIEQPRVRSWSTQLVVPTDAGRLWFKANCPALAHEAGVHEVLARLVPDLVDEPVAVDTARGWLLTRDRGPTLAERGEVDEADWRRIILAAADLQHRLVPHAADLLAAGLPDCRPATVAGRFDELIEQLSALDAGHPAHLDADERRSLLAARPRIVDAADELAASAVPASLDHGDTHPNNVLHVDGGPRLFDFGDAQWAHPFESLWTVWSWLTREANLPWEPVVTAYAGTWDEVVTRAEFDRLLRAAMITLPVNRAFTWYGSIALATAEQRAEWGSAPLSQLRHVTKPWPRD